jgi:hypothetical protein
MSVSGISGDSAGALFQWQNQKLQARASGSSGSSARAAKTGSLLGGYGNMSAQLSGMVELTRYAMNAMGLENDSRVTFSQIGKYREQLSTEFNNAVREGLGGLGVSDPTALTFTLSADGALTASGADSGDVAGAQAWLNANARLGKDLRARLDAAGAAADAPVVMTLVHAGKLKVTGAESPDTEDLAAVQGALDGSAAGKAIHDGLGSLAVAEDAAFTLKVNADGGVTIESADPAVKAAVQRFFDGNPELVKKFRQIEALSGLDDARKAMQISPSEMRRRIEIESLASWWAGTGNGNASFGSYSNDGLSILSGLNLSV